MDLSPLKNRILDTIVLAGIQPRGELILNLESLINERQRGICNIKNFWFMKDSATCDTVDGTRSYSIATDFVITGFRDDILLYYTDDDARTIIRPSGFDDVTKYYDADDEGAPAHFVLDGDNIDIYPLPDDAYEMTFLHYKYLADLSSTNTSNELTNNMPDILINGALADIFRMLGREDKANIYEGYYARNLKDLNAKDVSIRLPKEMHLKPRQGVYGNNLSTSYPKVLEDYW